MSAIRMRRVDAMHRSLNLLNVISGLGEVAAILNSARINQFVPTDEVTRAVSLLTEVSSTTRAIAIGLTADHAKAAKKPAKKGGQ